MTIAGYPPLRKDGLCACGCGKPLVREDRKWRGESGVRLDGDVLASHLANDPFISADCARQWFGLEARPGLCSQCGVDWSEHTPGCRVCRERQRQRTQRAA